MSLRIATSGVAPCSRKLVVWLPIVIFTVIVMGAVGHDTPMAETFSHDSATPAQLPQDAAQSLSFRVSPDKRTSSYSTDIPTTSTPFISKFSPYSNAETEVVGKGDKGDLDLNQPSRQEVKVNKAKNSEVDEIQFPLNPLNSDLSLGIPLWTESENRPHSMPVEKEYANEMQESATQSNVPSMHTKHRPKSVLQTTNTRYNPTLVPGQSLLTRPLSFTRWQGTSTQSPITYNLRRQRQVLLPVPLRLSLSTYLRSTLPLGSLAYSDPSTAIPMPSNNLPSSSFNYGGDRNHVQGRNVNFFAYKNSRSKRELVEHAPKKKNYVSWLKTLVPRVRRSRNGDSNVENPSNEHIPETSAPNRGESEKLHKEPGVSTARPQHSRSDSQRPQTNTVAQKPDSTDLRPEPQSFDVNGETSRMTYTTAQGTRVDVVKEYRERERYEIGKFRRKESASTTNYFCDNIKVMLELLDAVNANENSSKATNNDIFIDTSNRAEYRRYYDVLRSEYNRTDHHSESEISSDMNSQISEEMIISEDGFALPKDQRSSPNQLTAPTTNSAESPQPIPSSSVEFQIQDEEGNSVNGDLSPTLRYSDDKNRSSVTVIKTVRV